MSPWFFPQNFHALRGPDRYLFFLKFSHELYAAYATECVKLGTVVHDVGGERFTCDSTGEFIYTASFGSNRLTRYKVNVSIRKLTEQNSTRIEKPQRIHPFGKNELIVCATESDGVHLFDRNLDLLCVMEDAADIRCDSRSGLFVVSGRGKDSNFQVFDENVELLHAGSMPSFALAGIVSAAECVCVAFVGFGIFVMSRNGALLFTLPVDRLVHVYPTRDSGIILLKCVSVEGGVTELSYFDLRSRRSIADGVIKTLYLSVDPSGAFGLSDKGDLFNLANFQLELRFASP